MNSSRCIFFLLIAFQFTPSSFSQTVSLQRAEDTLNSSIPSTNATAIGGYGDAVYQNDGNAKISTVDLERVVLFVGHTYRDIAFFSELEMEDAKVSGGENGGEIAFEQAYLKFNLDQNHYITAGLFLPRLGILNENHLPTDFAGNERTQTETFIIPSTWRELGIGFYGSLNSLPVNYSAAIVNGLNSAAFEHGSGIREGRFEGRNASANNLAATGALQIYAGNFNIQTSGYFGGTVGLSRRQADSLQLNSGLFGTPVAIGEADMQYEANGLSIKILGTIVSIPNASGINRAYANNTPQSEFGAYAEAGYNILHGSQGSKEKTLIVFWRFETLDMNASIPTNGVVDGTLRQQHTVLGLNYLPIRNVVIKGDVRFVHTGNQNPALTIDPSPFAQPYKTNDIIVSFGMGFSF
jgi:hypothetical protein